MLITPSNLQALFTVYSFAYQAAFTTAEVYWRMLATMVPSSTESTTYAWMDKIPKLRKWIGPRVVQNAVARSPRVVINEPFELTLAVPKHKIQDDQYGLYTPLSTSMGAQAAKWPDDLLGLKLLENPGAFDGKAFFASDHPGNIDSGADPYSNLETNFPLTLENLAAARARMRSVKGADGRPIGARPTLLVVPPSLETTAETLLNSTFYPRLADGATLGNGDVAFAENPMKASTIKNFLVIDELEDQPDDWYLFDTSKPIMPMIFQLREAPVFTYLVNPNDPNVFFNKDFIMGCEARGAADVTMPFLAFKGEG
jgi:phage major head subunit gpT-like protein